MKIYFEDGELVSSGYLPIDHYIVINATSGKSQNIAVLEDIKETNPNAVIYTNSIFAFSNEYAWNKELNVPEIYIRAGEHMLFTRIDKLTEKELHKSHNLAKMYVAGSFGGITSNFNNTDNKILTNICDDLINQILKDDETDSEMSVAEFKEYLDMVVRSAFNEGVRWITNQTISKEEAIKNAQYKILIKGVKE